MDEVPCLLTITKDREGVDALVADGQGVVYYNWRRLDSMEEPLRRLLDESDYYRNVVEQGRAQLPKHTIEARLRTLIDSARRTR